MGIVLETLICFSKICNDKQEETYFNGNEHKKIYDFFYKESKKYPEEFQKRKIVFSKKKKISQGIKKELEKIIESKNILNISWNFFYYTFETKNNLLELYEKIKDKEIIEKIAFEFYNEIGCDKEGKLRKDYKKL